MDYVSPPNWRAIVLVLVAGIKGLPLRMISVALLDGGLVLGSNSRKSFPIFRFFYLALFRLESTINNTVSKSERKSMKGDEDGKSSLD